MQITNLTAAFKIKITKKMHGIFLLPEKYKHFILSIFLDFTEFLLSQTILHILWRDFNQKKYRNKAYCRTATIFVN